MQTINITIALTNVVKVVRWAVVDVGHLSTYFIMNLYAVTCIEDFTIFIYSCCASYVGRLGYGQQGISVGIGCLTFRTVVHEIGHAIGFWHEQSRPDRDDYVDILYDNIVRGFESNFRKKHKSEINSQGVGYDYNSIMHYNRDFFSSSYGLNTIQAKDPRIVIGLAVELSQYDILQTNRLYRCGKLK